MKYYRKERYYGQFSQSVLLPENVEHDTSKIMAKYEDGVLNITVPKKEPVDNDQQQIKIL